MKNVIENNHKSTTNFSNFLSSVRKIGRQVVLPVNKIKTICGKYFSEKEAMTVLDFGSGTLFWTDWFAKELNCTVYAVDPYYENFQNIARENVTYYSDINKCFENHPTISAVWACDVLHHLSKADYENFLITSMAKTNLLIVKDIDMRHKFGNFMNRMHDKWINKENINDINPEDIKTRLSKNGFETFYYYAPKLWYPHFLVIGIKKFF